MIRLHIKIDDVLHVWVRRWARYTECRGYPSLFLFRAKGALRTRFTIEELAVEEYLKIDEAVMTLHDLNLEAYQVLMAVFLQGQDKKDICLEMQISPRTFDRRLRTARDFMEGAVFGSGLIKVRF